jgi:hypothetical protein
MTTGYDFSERLAWSKARRQDSDLETLRAMFPKAASVTKTSIDEDRAGTDYVVELRRGALLRVDAKARDRGSRQWWKAGPEVALETWSVMPGGKYETPDSRRRVGWALDESKEIDLILYTFDPDEHEFAYVRPFPLIRETFRRNCREWRAQYKTAPQDNGAWRYESECMFVPLVVLDQAIEAMSRRRSDLCPGSDLTTQGTT